MASCGPLPDTVILTSIPERSMLLVVLVFRYTHTSSSLTVLLNQLLLNDREHGKTTKFYGFGSVAVK